MPKAIHLKENLNTKIPPTRLLSFIFYNFKKFDSVVDLHNPPGSILPNIPNILFRFCATWSKMGECQKNPGWMLKNCPVSCKECKNKCADHEVYCNEWKAQGECNTAH